MRTRQPESSLAAHASQINVHCSQSVKSELPFSVLKRLALKGRGVVGGVQVQVASLREVNILTRWRRGGEPCALSPLLSFTSLLPV